MLKQDGEKVVVNIVLTRAQTAALNEYSKKIGIGISALLRLIVTEWMEGREHV